MICAEAATWNSAEHIVPVIQTRSCMPFLCALSEFLNYCNNANIQLLFLKQENIQSYLNAVSTCNQYTMNGNWFTRLESQFIINVLKIAVQVKENTNLGLFYEIAVKCMSIFNLEQKVEIEFVLDNIVFDPCFYPTESLLNNLKITHAEEELNFINIKTNLPNISSVYKSILNLQKVCK